MWPHPIVKNAIYKHIFFNFYVTKVYNFHFTQPIHCNFQQKIGVETTALLGEAITDTGSQMME